MTKTKTKLQDELIKLKELTPKTKQVVATTQKHDKTKLRPHHRPGLMKGDRKRRLLLKAFDLYAEGLTFDQIALSLKIPSTSCFNLLTDDANYEYIKSVKSKATAIKFLDDIELNRQAQDKLRSKASFSQLGTDIGIKWDKVHPPQAQTVNVGNKIIEVTMPSFFKPRKKYK